MKKLTAIIIIITELIFVNYLIFVKIYGCHPYTMNPGETFWVGFTGFSLVVALFFTFLGIITLLISKK